MIVGTLSFLRVHIGFKASLLTNNCSCRICEAMQLSMVSFSKFYIVENESQCSTLKLLDKLFLVFGKCSNFFSPYKLILLFKIGGEVYIDVVYLDKSGVKYLKIYIYFNIVREFVTVGILYAIFLQDVGNF